MLESPPVSPSPRSWLAAAASTVDRAVVEAVRWRNRTRPSRADSLSHAERMKALAHIERAYGDPRLIATPEAFFPPRPPIAPELTSVLRATRAVRVVDASWPSAYEPFLHEIRAKYLGHRRNDTAHARLFFGGGERQPRPFVILIHGYLGGYWLLEEQAFPVRWFLRHGVDVGLFVLPFHALRAREDRSGPPPFPGADPRFVNEGFRQTVGDLGSLVAWLKTRGAPSVGVMGMSLGGYTTALAATVLGDLSFAVPMIPLASIADFAREQGRLGEGHVEEEEHRALEAATRVVSPFARPSRIAKERVLVLAGDGDRITPMSHAERVARHLGAPLVRFPGGHLLQIGRSHAFREVGGLLRQLRIMR
jgi:pimeloyl-ACP methyl ester carboxylesterase